MKIDVTAAQIDVTAFLEELKAWVEIETHTPNADAVNRLADRVEKNARDAGLTCERIKGTMGYGDILAVRTPRPAGNNQKGILVLAHLDTVHAIGTIEEKLPLRQEGDRYYGPGIYDMKAGALAALEAVKLVTARGGAALPIDLVFIPDEEVGSISSRSVIEDFARNARYTLVAEPARDGGKVVVARKGSAVYDILVKGRASHAGSKPHEGRSAIKAAARIVLELETLNDYARGVSVTVGTIIGGTGRNTVPAECRMQIDIRLPDAEAASEVLGRIESLKPVDPDITIEVTGGIRRPPYAQSSEGKALFDHAANIANELGFELVGMASGGGSDGNFTGALGVPTLDGLGPDGAGHHTFNEHIFVSSIAPRTTLLANLLLTLN